MPIVRQKFIARQDLQDNPQALFLFGDNLAQFGLAGQAKEMRGEPNAVGIPTKKTPWVYLTNKDFAKLKDLYFHIFLKLRRHLAKGGTVVVPTDGIGSGLANLEIQAPKIHKHLNAKFRKLQEYSVILLSKEE